ncbi:MFS transporter [Methanobacterium oryzae]|uniref:MFS transporter n=1 Tax=Methanobacterium oryzae TaxID=69540 RepID=UPI003D25AC8A
MGEYTTDKTNKKSIGESPFFVMIVLALGVFMTGIDAYIFIPALPTLTKDLNTSFELVSWTLTVLMLFMTAVMPLAGKLSDVFGRKRLYIVGVATFIIGSFAASFSWDIYSLIVSMAIQGIGAGIVLPSAISTMNDSAPEDQRGKTMGVLMAMSSLAMIIGPNIGGFLIQNFGWRTIFYVNIPIGILAIILAFKFKESHGETNPHIDYMGSLLLIGSIATMLLALVRVQTLPFTDITVLPLFIASIVLFISLIKYEKRVSEPILDIPLLKKSKILSLNIAILLSGLATFTAFTYVPTFAQLVLNTNVQNSGLLLTPLSITLLITAILGGVLLDKFGAKRMLLLGSPVLSAGLFWLAYYVTDSISLSVALVLIGIGMGFTTSAFQVLMMSFIPRNEEGTGVGILNTFKGVGGTIGPIAGSFFLGTALSGTITYSHAFSNLFMFGTIVSIIAIILLIIVVIMDRTDESIGNASESIAGK